MFMSNDDNNWYKIMSLGTALMYKIQSDQELINKAIEEEIEQEEYNKQDEEHDEEHDKNHDEKQNKKQERPKIKRTSDNLILLEQRNKKVMVLIGATGKLLRSARIILEKTCDDLGLDKKQANISNTLYSIDEGVDAVFFIKDKVDEIGKKKVLLDEKQLSLILQFMNDMIKGLYYINISV